MKKLIQKTLIATLCATALSAQANQFDDKVRLVISPAKQMGETVFSENAEPESAGSQACVTSPDGVSFVVRPGKRSRESLPS